MNGGSSSGIPSNLGILDQIAALHWIQENIQDFGGKDDIWDFITDMQSNLLPL